MLEEHEKLISSIKEHDSLMVKDDTQHLTTEEKKAAWDAFEANVAGRSPTYKGLLQKNISRN